MATFGKLTDGATTSNITADVCTISKFTLSEDGSVSKLTIRCWVGTNARNAKGIIYADNAGSPGALQAVTNQVSVSGTSEAAVDFTFAAPEALTAGDWWLGIILDAAASPNDFNLSRDNTASQRYTASVTYPTPADPYSGSATTGPLDVYATYTPTATFIPTVIII